MGRWEVPPDLIPLTKEMESWAKAIWRLKGGILVAFLNKDLLFFILSCYKRQTKISTPMQATEEKALASSHPYLGLRPFKGGTILKGGPGAILEGPKQRAQSLPMNPTHVLLDGSKGFMKENLKRGPTCGLSSSTSKEFIRPEASSRAHRVLCDSWEAQVAREKEAGCSPLAKRYDISMPEPHSSPLSLLLDRTPMIEFFG